jgi:hypothetical protein
MSVTAKMLANWIERQREDFRARNLPAPMWLQNKDYCQEQASAELHALAQQRAKSFEAQEIRRLREEVRELQKWFTPGKSKLTPVIRHVADYMVEVIGEAMAVNNKEISKEANDLRTRIDKLEQRQLLQLPNQEPVARWISPKALATKNYRAFCSRASARSWATMLDRSKLFAFMTARKTMRIV